MRSRMYFALIGVMVLTVFTVKAQHGSKSHDEMNKRGDHVMGFDHTKTTHAEKPRWTARNWHKRTPSDMNVIIPLGFPVLLVSFSEQLPTHRISV